MKTSMKPYITDRISSKLFPGKRVILTRTRGACIKGSNETKTKAWEPRLDILSLFQLTWSSGSAPVQEMVQLVANPIMLHTVKWRFNSWSWPCITMSAACIQCPSQTHSLIRARRTSSASLAGLRPSKPAAPISGVEETLEMLIFESVTENVLTVLSIEADILEICR